MGCFAFVSGFIIFSIFLQEVCAGGSDHKNLLRDLMANYDIHERPTLSENDTVQVKFGITLLHLVEMNPLQGHLGLNMWLSFEWNDPHLQWDEEKYGGIDHITMKIWKIWNPDIYLYNSIHPNLDPTFQTNAVIKSDGTVLYVPPGIFKSTCPTEIPYYPYDEHLCYLKFGSWTWNGDKINMSLKSGDGMDLTEFSPHSEWEILGTTGVVNTKFYSCCKEAYVDATFTLNLKRKGGTLFWGTTCALFLAYLSLILALFLPCNSNLRITLGVITLLVLMFMIDAIEEGVNGRLTILASYVQSLSFLTFVSIALNICVLNLYTRNPSRENIPNWVKSVFCKILPQILCLRPNPRTSLRNESASPDGRLITPTEGFNEHFEGLLSDLQGIVQKMNESHAPTNLTDWQYFCMVLDRFALIVYGLIFFLYFGAYFCQFW